MQNVTVRLRQELIDSLDEEADERDASRSEYIREILNDRHRADELAKELDDLRDRLNSREERVQELEEQLARRSQIEEKVDTLARQQQEQRVPFFVEWYRWFRGRGQAETQA